MNKSNIFGLAIFLVLSLIGGILLGTRLDSAPPEIDFDNGDVLPKYTTNTESSLDYFHEISSALDGLTPHAPIEITDVSNFTTLGFPGTGTYWDPFIIESLEIESPVVPCISITGNITAYYNITGCRISGMAAERYWDEFAVILLGAGNGTVHNCEVYNASYGITCTSGDKQIHSVRIWDCEYQTLTLKHAYDVSIENCTFSNTLYFYDVHQAVIEHSSIDSLILFSTSYLVFEECFIGKTFGTGNSHNEFVDCVLAGSSSVFSLNQDSQTEVINCTVSVELELGSGARIQGCIFNNTRYGIHVWGDNLYITDNILLGVDGSIGISILGYNQERITIRNNTITGFSTGINVQCDGSFIIENIITNCGAGIYVTGNENTIYRNFMNNNQFHARDYGTENQWISNYYGLRLLLGPYIISGTAGSIDISPMNAQFIGPILIFAIPLSVGVFGRVIISRKYGTELLPLPQKDDRIEWQRIDSLLLYMSGLPFTLVALITTFVGTYAMIFSSLFIATFFVLLVAGFILHKYGPPNSFMLRHLWEIPTRDSIQPEILQDQNRKFLLIFFLSYAFIHYLMFSDVLLDGWVMMIQVCGLIGWTIFIGLQARTMIQKTILD
ncbi:MAG: hypothetical protein JW779_02245 [Candidatus Thorarchaeota archaeon]|nr:hypothetical protein [Candidatus Thorarchaeota archaeon]